MFLALPIPSHVQTVLHAALAAYSDFLAHRQPLEQWHMTLFDLGEKTDFTPYQAALLQPLPQTFIPTVTITHLGKGKKADQLWAFVLPSNGLIAQREQLLQRLRTIGFPLPKDSRDPFTPHITLGSFKPEFTRRSVADHPISATFVPSALHAYDQ